MVENNIVTLLKKRKGMSSSERIEYIEHQAIVKGIDSIRNIVKVRIDDIEECGDCPASKMCGTKGETSNLVDIQTPLASDFKEGDIITVRGTETMHRKAIIYTMALPCLLLVATMVGIYLLTENQLASALSGLGITILYYFMLWICRDRLSHQFTFTIVGKVERAGEMK